MVQEDKESPSQKFVKFEEYSNKTGRTLYYADCSAVEAAQTAHSLLCQLEEAHGPKTVHAHGSDQHLKRFTRIFSSKNFGPDKEEEMITQEQVDEINNLLQNEMMDTEEPVDASQYFVLIPDSVKRELEHMRTSCTVKDFEILAKDREILALKARLAKYEDLGNNNNS